MLYPSIGEFISLKRDHDRLLEESSTYISNPYWRDTSRKYQERISNIIEKGWDGSGFGLSLSILNRSHRDICHTLKLEIGKNDKLKLSEDMKKKRLDVLTRTLDALKSFFDKAVNVLLVLCKEEDALLIKALLAFSETETKNKAKK